MNIFLIIVNESLKKHSLWYLKKQNTIFALCYSKFHLKSIEENLSRYWSFPWIKIKKIMFFRIGTAIYDLPKRQVQINSFWLLKSPWLTPTHRFSNCSFAVFAMFYRQTYKSRLEFGVDSKLEYVFPVLDRVSKSSWLISSMFRYLSILGEYFFISLICLFRLFFFTSYWLVGIC